MDEGYKPRRATLTGAGTWREFCPVEFRAHADDLHTFGSRDLVAWATRAASAGVADAGNVILVGPPGTRKTTAAYALARPFVEARSPVLFRTVVDLYAELAGPGHAVTLERAKNADVLILDDLTAASPAPTVRPHLFGIVDHRYSWRLPIIATTTSDTAQLVQTLGASIYDRLIHRAVIVEFAGESQRDLYQESARSERSSAE